MANNYDEAIKKNRQYLTQAQIDALVAASQQYNNQNAGNRAGALASAREQYDVGYRGLQNMGLAGASGAAPTSGEVPRLEQQIRTPFEDYNNRLRDVERQRLGALGNQFAQQTQAQWAAEAERQRQAQEAAARARAAAAAVGVNTKFAAAIQGVEDAARQAQINAINAKGMKQTAQVKQQAFDNGIGSLLSPAEKAQRDGMLRTARPQDVAAAAAFNIAHYAQATVAERANADQERGIKLTEKLKGSADSSNANKYYNGPNNTAFSQSEADAEYKSAQQTLDNLKLKQHYGGKVSAEEMTAAQNAALIAKVKAEDPEYYSAINTVNSTTATPDAKRKANMVIADRSTTEAVNAMGYKSTMSSAQFDDASKVIPDLRMQLNIIDSTRNRMSNGGTGGQKTIDEAIAELEKHGYTEQETRELVKQFDDERYFRREYDYLNNAYTALFEHQGEKPEKPLNSKEMNPTYWAVNGNVDPEGKTLRNIGKSSTKAIAMLTESFMTQEQRDAYNAIYEKDGIKAANAYAQAIKPFLEMQAAEADRKYFEEFASDENWLKRFQAWAFVRGSNLLGSVPAMAEKLIVNGQNIVQEGKTNGTGVLKKYSPDSNISRISNWADIVQTKQSQDILEKYDKQNRPGMGKFVNFWYNTGTSMADSIIAMGVSGALGSWATDVLFFSSAGNQAYKDAIDRGATQEQAMGLAFLSGTAEALFEHVSLDKLTQTLKFKGKPIIQAVKDALTQAGVEGSEEFFTEIANVLSDFAIMKDKSEMQEAINNGELGKFLWEHLSSATIGGLASGLLFGLAGVGGAALSQAKDSKAKSSLGSKVRENSNVQQVKNTAILLGGEAMQQAEKVQKRETDANVGEMTATVLNEIQSLGQELNQDQQVGLTRILDGSEMTAEEAKDVHELLGKETLEKFSYDAATPEAFQKSYNDRLQKHNVTSREETMQKASEERFAKTKQDAAARVWANPEQGLSLTTPEGGTVRPMPGNMTAVALAEQERTGFKTRSSATKGKVTYSVAGMQTREGLTNEQAYDEIQKGFTKEARKKAQIYEKLADALGVKMIIHDVMTGTNGFIDEKGNMHVVLSGKQSVLRVAAHELTHLMKEKAGNEYASMRDHLISEVGQEKFDRMTKQKANEYGIDLSTEKGKILADDEVCAELCERMLSNEEALEKFAEKDLPAAKTLKEHLLKILNAIKDAFKRAENRDFGESWSDLIRQQDTIESWITGLQKAIDNANARSNTVEGQIAKTAGVTTVDQAQMDEDMRAELFLDDNAIAAESRREKAKANAEKGTKVDGITDDEMSRILSRSVYGDKSNYDSDDFKSVQSMLAQLVPEAIDALNGNADLDEVYAEIKTAVGEMLDKYYLDEGDHSALRELIPEVIAVDSTAKSDLKAQDTSLFQMSSKLKKALGRKVTLVGPTNEKFKSAMKLEELWHSAQDRFGLSDYQDFSVDTQKLLDFVQSQTAVRDFDSLHKSERDNIVTYQANEFVSAVDEMLAERVDKVIAEHSVDVIEYDMAGYRADLEQKGLMSKGELDELFTTMKKAVKYVKEHRAILDFGEELNTEEDIVAAKQNRAYLPYKQNADPHYKLALDFSTLCKKRILLQMIQERLQGKLKRSLSALETIAIRREILKLQKNGVDVEVACALCYVEAARMKSHKVIDEFLGVGMTKAGRAANVEAEMRNYFAQKDKDIKKVIDKDLAKWKEDKLGKDWTGFTKSGKKVGAANASKDHLKAFGGQKLVDEYNAFAKGTRSKAKVNDAQEEIIKAAKRLVQETPEAFLSAESLAKMKKSNPDIFYAFVNKVRSATRSKALETDTFYSRGDIDMVDEAIIRAANQESGFRHQSWSDFMPIHLLDTMASVIEMSQRDAKMHAYTKVPAMVELLGNTGMMLNMSMIPKGATGLKADGTLDFDSVEGMDWDTMMRLRDAFPDTAGNIAIGISDEQIRKLLDSPDIDYVIPYHASGMNQTLRTHMNIEHWVEYTKTQNEVEKDGYAPDGKTWKEKHKNGKMKPPALARWFSEEDAKKAGKNGVEYMQKASEKYIDICNKEGWIPKFPQYLTKDADGNYHLNDEYKNYWKMLTVRKMVNHLTGKVIIQQAVKPKFNEQTVMDILKGEAENPTAIRNAAAADEIAGELAKTWRADRENANLKSYKAELNAFREASAVMAADRVKEDVKRRLAETRNSLDTDYMRLAEKQKNGTLTKEDESKLRKMVDEAAKAAGYTIKAYHGSRAIFTEFSDEMRGSSTKTQASKKWHFAADYETANSYYPAGVMRELIKQNPSWFSQKDLDSMDRRGISGKLYPLYLKMNNPLVVDVAGYDYESHKANKDAMMEYVEQADREGRDGIILTHVRDNNLRPEAEESTDYMFRSSSQAKLADLVTYDKDGNIIPLSERFRTDRTGDESWKNKDIRYSIDTDHKRSISEIDAEYEEALEANDPDWQAMLVNEKAHRMGYTVGAYHGSPEKGIREFATNANSSKKEKLQLLFGTHFTRQKSFADIYAHKQRNSKGTSRMKTSAGKVYDVYLDLGKSLNLVNAANYSEGSEMFSLYKDLPEKIRKKVPSHKYTEYEAKEGMGRTGEEYVNTGDIEKALQEMTPKDAFNFLKAHDYNSVEYNARYNTGSWDNNAFSRDESIIMLDPERIKSADPVTYDKEGNVIHLSDRFNKDDKDIYYDLDTDSIRQAFTVIDTEGIEDGLEALKDVKHVGSFALKDITRFLDASAGKNKDLRNTLHAIFEAPHSEATGRYARGVERMQQKVLDIGKRAGVCDEKGKHFDSKKSAAIQNIGEGFSNTYTDLKLKVKDADHVTVRAYEPGTDNLVDSEKDYTLKELRQAYGTNAADYVWSRVFDETQKAQETGGKPGWVDEKVNTRPYTIDDLQTAYPNDWQKLKAAADEFRQMYDEYIRDQNNMLATIYPIESEYADVEKLDAGIEKKQERLAQHKAAVNTQIENLQKSLEAKEKEIASKKRTDTNAYRQLVEQANKLTSRIAEVKAEIAEYEANAKDEIMKMNVLKAEMQNAVQKGDYSLKRMHRLQYRSDYFHHFTEMASGIQNLKSIFTNNTDIAPAIVGKSENTKAKTKWAGYFQQRMGGDYTADALNGMLRYGQLAEYKLAFDPLTAYLRDVNKQIRNLSSDANRDGLIRYIDQWADTIAGKSHKLDRVVSDSGMAPRKAMQVLQWINSRVIQNTLLWNMRSALVQISNITNAKGIVKNNIDWVNGLKAWALAAKGDEAMASIMSQSNFLASRYMDGLALTDSKLKSAKQFAGWMLGALDEISAKATWWAAYQQYTRNPNAAKNQYRNYESAVDYADDITRRTHAGRGVGELAPAMTSRVINFVAPFQVEVNNTWQLLKDNVKQKNYLGLLSTGLSVFLFNTFFEAIVGSTPLGFDFIRAVVDIALGFLNDDPDDDPDAKEIGQRFAGELVGGLPFASQLVAAFGEDNAKKLLGENNDATRYGNTQIGVNAVVNALKGLKDIGTGLIEGRKVNWLDDIDDLMNLTLPMGAKQLTRTAQGLATVAKGYAGKYDKAGDEKVQFVTDQDVLHYIHAGLFGKWALTEASEYFGEKRLLPQLFGKYNGTKSSIGNMVDAKEYKAALQTGIDGKQYFTLKYDLKNYTTQAGKRAEMMEQPFTNEQKAQLDALLIADSKKGSKAEGSVVYQKDNDGNWTVKADYSSSDWMDVAELGDTKYNQAKESGIKPETFASICTAWKGMSGKDKKDQAREYLNGLHLTKDQYDYIWTNVFKYKAE